MKSIKFILIAIDIFLFDLYLGIIFDDITAPMIVWVSWYALPIVGLGLLIAGMFISTERR